MDLLSLKFYKKHIFAILVSLILIISAALRFYNFQAKIGFGGDAGRDAMIAQIALQRHELPLFGSFSSAGPFVFGPLFYYFNMLAYILFPFTVYAPWILMAITGILTVIVFMLIGYFVEGKRLAVILGSLVAFSPQFVSRSTTLGQHTLVGITSALLILFFILFYKKKKLIYPFIAGLSLGAALSMHYQALNLFLFFPALLFIPKITWKNKILAEILMFLGFFIPSFPLLYWDSHQNFANIRNILDYVLIAQYRIYVPNSWKIYLIKFLPDYWANVVGGIIPVAAAIMIISGFTFIYSLIKKKIQGEVLILGIIFAALLVVIRYYRGERFEGYMVYIAPFIFLFSGWAMLTLFDLINDSKLMKKVSKIKRKAFVTISILLFVTVLAFDFDNAKQFLSVSNEYAENLEKIIQYMQNKFPKKKFSVYDYEWKTGDNAYALVFLLNKKGLIDQRGHPIGIDYVNSPATSGFKELGQFVSLSVVDLKSNHKKKISKNFVRVNPDDIYDDLETRWTKRQKLTATFDPGKYILERLHLSK